MSKLNNNNIKIAIQKDGRLSENSLGILESAGLDFDSYKRRLFAIARNFPLEILFVRDDDIPDYVEAGNVELGIVGQNVIYEEESDVEELASLDFGYCSLVVAVPKDSKLVGVVDLEGKTVATSHPNSTQKFLENNGVQARIVKIAGSVEVTPAMDVADAIVDLSATGSTLELNDLRPIAEVYSSQAVLITNRRVLENSKKREKIDRLLTRIKAILKAKEVKYIMMNAPRAALAEIQQITPGLRAPTVVPLVDDDWVAVHAVVAEETFWEVVEKLRSIGAEGILVSPIEKMIL